MSATSPEFMAPAVETSFQIKGLIRSTGWASVREDGSWRCPAVVVRSSSGKIEGNETVEVGDGIMLSGQGPPPWPGEIRPVAIKITVPSGGDLPGMFDHRMFLKGRGIRWKGKILDEQIVPNRGLNTLIFARFLNPFRTTILNELKQLLPSMEASLASSVLLGAKDETSRAASSPFSDLGLAHLFAVSGLHVGVLLGLFLLPGKLIGVSAWKKWFFLLLILPFYCLLTGLPGSVIRAAGLALLATASAPFGRTGTPLHFLGLLFWSTTMWRPDQVLDTGVRLSYSAAAGILAFTSLSRGIEYPRRGFRGFILGGLFISLAAQWFTLPLAATSFGRISLISPLANLVAVPTFGAGVWLVVISLVGSSLFPGLGEILGALAWLVFRALAGVVRFTEISTGGLNMGMPVPGPFLIFTWAVFTIISLVSIQKLSTGRLNGKVGVLIISLCGIISTAGFTGFFKIPFKSNGPEVWQFDVGQGDCAIIRFPDGWSAMIDTAGLFGFSGKSQDGPLSRKIHPWLKRHKNTDFDVVILTHGHLDHTGGVQFLRSNSQASQWLVSGKAGKSLSTDVKSVAVVHPTEGEVLHNWEDWSLEVIFPYPEMPDHFHENDFSMVVALRKKSQTQVLWSGDLEVSGETLIMDRPAGIGETRIWKAGHHGSNTSGSQPFLNAINPELILISCGVGNRYRHPSHGVYMVQNDTIPVVRTDLDGSIHLRFEENGDIYWKSSSQHGLLAASP